MVRKKRARVEGDGVEGRTGVMWRSPNHVVEMRLPKKVAELKLHFGSYKSVAQATVARDYGAYVRDSTGKEDRATVGGFSNSADHPSIFAFEESPEVFGSLEGSGSRAQARCDEYKNLLELQTKEACTKFCKAAKEDIRVAIESFRSRDPQKFAEPIDGGIHRTLPPSNSEVTVPPTPGREVGASMGEGSTSFSAELPLELQMIVKGYPFQKLLQMNVFYHTHDEILKIVKEQTDGIQRELIRQEQIKRELLDNFLEDLEPRTTLPETIPGFNPQCDAENP